MISAEQGGQLLRLARCTLEAEFGRRKRTAAPEIPNDPIFQEHRGVFISLIKRDQLRGCIGSLLGIEPLADAVRRHTVNAAFSDRRFPMLSADELPDVRIEISVLPAPHQLAYTDGENLVCKLRPRVDGVIIKMPQGMGATFLPQVWHELPDPEIFLEQLCRKAGLTGNAWHSRCLISQTDRAVRFTEEEPLSWANWPCRQLWPTS
jgi:AmmeMemoRadiSam system protein A